MARYKKVYGYPTQIESVTAQINSYLISRGYTYKNYNGEMLYHIGDGWLSPPRCIKVFTEFSSIVVESWMKYSILPYVAVGEFDISSNSFVGAFFKGKMREEVRVIEQIIMQYQGDTYQGIPLGQDNVAEQGPAVQNTSAPTEQVDASNITKREFLERYAPMSLRGDLKKAAIIGYICSGISAVFGLVMMNPFAILEVMIMVGLLLGMHLGRSKACAIIYLCIACLDCLVSIVTYGIPAGWLVIVAGILAVVTFGKIDKQYKEFKTTGMRGNGLR